MSIKNFDQIKTLIDIGMEKGYLTPDEINDFLPQNIFSPEDIEDIFDFLSESNIDVVETIKEKIETAEEEPHEWEEAERFPTEKTDNIIWAYLKDIGRISLLSSEEEYDIAKRIEEGEARIRSRLFDMPLAITELQELVNQIKKETINIIDVVKNIDEMNYTKKDEEQHKKKIITLSNSLKNLHEKREEMKKQLGPGVDEFTKKQTEKKLAASGSKIEEVLTNLGLQKKVLEEITRRVQKRAKFLDDKEARSVEANLREMELVERESESRQEPPDQGEPEARDQHCQEVPEQRAFLPRSHTGRQHGPHEGGRKVRLPERLQVLHVLYVVDKAGHHTGHRGLREDDQGAGARPRNDEQDHEGDHIPLSGVGKRADPRGDFGQGRLAPGKGAEDNEGLQRAHLDRDAHR